MKYFVIRIFYFALVAFLIYSCLLFFTGTYLPSYILPNILTKGIAGHTRTRLKEASEYKPVDVLFLGSSHAYRGFDVRIFNKHGLSSFNLGSSAQTPLQTNLLMDRYLDGFSPKLVVYEVYPTIFSIDGTESFIDILTAESIDLNALKIGIKHNNLKLTNALLYHFFQNQINNLENMDEPIKIDGDTYISGGYVERIVSNYRLKVPYPSRKLSFNSSQLSAFEDILIKIKRRNIKIILVFAPLTTSLYNSYVNIAAFDSMMACYGDYYNFNEMITLNDSIHFFDEDHLNQMGVIAFNNELVKILKEDYLFVD